MKLLNTKMSGILFLLVSLLLELLFGAVAYQHQSNTFNTLTFWLGLILLPLLVLFQWINTSAGENSKNNFAPATVVFLIGYGATMIFLILGWSMAAITALIITFYLGLDKPWNFDFKKMILSAFLALIMAMLGYLMTIAQQQSTLPIETTKVLVLETTLSEADLQVETLFHPGDTIILEGRSGKITIKDRP